MESFLCYVILYRNHHRGHTDKIFKLFVSWNLGIDFRHRFFFVIHADPRIRTFSKFVKLNRFKLNSNYFNVILLANKNSELIFNFCLLLVKFSVWTEKIVLNCCDNRRQVRRSSQILRQHWKMTCDIHAREKRQFSSHILEEEKDLSMYCFFRWVICCVWRRICFQIGNELNLKYQQNCSKEEYCL